METMHAAGRRRLPPVPRPAGDRAAGQLTVERPRPTPVDAPDPAAEPVVDRSDTELIDTHQIATERIDAELAALAEAARPSAAPAGDAGTVDGAGSADTAQIRPADVAAGVAAADAPEVAEPEAAKPEIAEPEAAEPEAAEPEAAEPEAAETPADADAVDPEIVAPPVPQQQAEPVVAETAADGPVEEQDPAQQFVARLRSSAADFAAAAGADSAVVREAVPPARHRRARCRLVLRYADGHVADLTFIGPAGVPGRPSRHGFDRLILRWLGAGLRPDDAWVVADEDAPDGVAVDLSAWLATA